MKMDEISKPIKLVLRILGIFVFAIFAYSFIDQEASLEKPRGSLTVLFYVAAFILPFQFLMYGLTGKSHNAVFPMNEADPNDVTQ